VYNSLRRISSPTSYVEVRDSLVAVAVLSFVSYSKLGDFKSIISTPSLRIYYHSKCFILTSDKDINISKDTISKIISWFIYLCFRRTEFRLFFTFSTIDGLSLNTRILGGFPVFCSPRWRTGVTVLLLTMSFKDAVSAVKRDDLEPFLQSNSSVLEINGNIIKNWKTYFS